MMILVFGPHGSGNRLNHRIVCASPLINVPGKQSRVWSLPGRVKDITDKTAPGDFYVVGVRDAEYTAQSMLKEGMTTTIDQARLWVTEAREQVEELRDVWGEENFIDIHYEDTVKFGADYTISVLAEFFGCGRWEFDEAIVDGNAKYLDVEPNSLEFG